LIRANFPPCYENFDGLITVRYRKCASCYTFRRYFAFFVWFSDSNLWRNQRAIVDLFMIFLIFKTILAIIQKCSLVWGRRSSCFREIFNNWIMTKILSDIVNNLIYGCFLKVIDIFPCWIVKCWKFRVRTKQWNFILRDQCFTIILRNAIFVFVVIGWMIRRRYFRICNDAAAI